MVPVELDLGGADGPVKVVVIEGRGGGNSVIDVVVTAVAIALVLGIAGSTWEAIHARRAEREQRRLRLEAQAARQDATEKLWASASRASSR